MIRRPPRSTLAQVHSFPTRRSSDLKKRQIAFVESSRLFTQEEKKTVRRRCESIGSGQYAHYIHSYEGSDKGDQNSLNQSVETTEELSQEKETETKTEVETHSQKETDMDLQKISFHKWNDSSSWNRDLCCFDLSWLQFEDVFNQDWNSLKVFRQSLSAVKDEFKVGLSNCFHPISKSEVYNPVYVIKNPCGMPLYRLADFISQTKDVRLKSISKHFHPSIFVTHNFAPAIPQGVLESALDPLAPNRKIVSEILVIEERQDHGKSKLHIGLIDHGDVRYWRKRLSESLQPSEKVRIAIYSLRLAEIIETSDLHWQGKDLFSHEEFLTALVQIKFYNGNVKYSDQEKKILSTWILKSGVRNMYEAFRDILSSTNSLDSLSCSDIEQIFDELLCTKNLSDLLI